MDTPTTTAESRETIVDIDDPLKNAQITIQKLSLEKQVLEQEKETLLRENSDLRSKLEHTSH